MPKKSKRVASRQAQLSGRGRRARPHGPSGIPTKQPAPPVSKPLSEDGAATEATIEPTAIESPPAFRQQTEASAPPPPPTQRPRSRAATHLSAAAFFKTEIRRIGLVSGLVFGILIILAFVLQ